MTRPAHVYLLLIGTIVALARGAIVAQQRPVAAMFGDDQKRGGAIALSFATAEAPPTASLGVPLQIYLTAGDLERAFDQPAFRPDAAIVPTNTELMLTAPSPGTQAVLIDRVRKQTAVMRDLQEQVDARRKQKPSSPAGGGLLEVGIDSFVAQLPRQGSRGGAAFPKSVCLIATDFPKGGAIDRRELFAQDRMRKGIAGCLAALDASGVESVVVPLMGAASSGTQAKDPVFEGQRVLKECRLLNSVAGIALGIHDFAPARRSIREIGVIQWDREITDMFSLPRGTRLTQTAQNAYRAYAEQITQGFRTGLAGEKTTAADVDGNCNAIFTQ
jgi:hypothetical protein